MVEKGIFLYGDPCAEILSHGRLGREYRQGGRSAASDPIPPVQAADPVGREAGRHTVRPQQTSHHPDRGWDQTRIERGFGMAINYFKEADFEIIKLTYDLHSEIDWEDIQTEHEKMFSEKGIKIKALIARLTKK